MENLAKFREGFDNPAELALIWADEISSNSTLENTLAEEQVLVKLEKISERLGFHRRYFVETNRALAIPISYDRDQPVTYTNFGEGLTFSGSLVTFATVKIGRLAIAETSVRAPCLTFDSALLLPYFETLEEDRLLYTPAYAINDIRPEYDGDYTSGDDNLT